MKPLSLPQMLIGIVFWLLFTIATLFAIVIFIPMMFINGKYAKRILHALDHVANAAINRSPDHTISSQCGIRIRDEDAGWFCKTVCRILDKIDPGHCIGSIEDNHG